MAGYEWIYLKTKGTHLLIKEGMTEPAKVDDLPQRLGIIVNETTGDVMCKCSDTQMARVDGKYPSMESNYRCLVCGKEITVVWD